MKQKYICQIEEVYKTRELNIKRKRVEKTATLNYLIFGMGAFETIIERSHPFVVKDSYMHKILIDTKQYKFVSGMNYTQCYQCSNYNSLLASFDCISPEYSSTSLFCNSTIMNNFISATKKDGTLEWTNTRKIFCDIIGGISNGHLFGVYEQKVNIPTNVILGDVKGYDIAKWEGGYFETDYMKNKCYFYMKLDVLLVLRKEEDESLPLDMIKKYNEIVDLKKEMQQMKLDKGEKYYMVSDDSDDGDDIDFP